MRKCSSKRHSENERGALARGAADTPLSLNAAAAAAVAASHCAADAALIKMPPLLLLPSPLLLPPLVIVPLTPLSLNATSAAAAVAAVVAASHRAATVALISCRGSSARKHSSKWQVALQRERERRSSESEKGTARVRKAQRE